MNESLLTWLLEGEPWVRYGVYLDLLEPKQDNNLQQTYQAILAHENVKELITELQDWPGSILKSHKKAGHLLHKLVFLADIGLKADNPSVKKIVKKILLHQSNEGPFQVLVNINPRYGGSGEDEYAWMLCDAPHVSYALAKFGLADDTRVRASLNHLLGLRRENGWPCAVSPEIGKFRGPGKKADPCPYANLIMLRLIAQFPDMHDSPEAKLGVETLLSLWTQRKERRPYLFAMGTDFQKLKLPFVWYDILHLTHVLSQFNWALKDSRLQEMLQILSNKADKDGKFTPESVWVDWKHWEFGQKKEPSKWLTLQVLKVLKQVGISH